MDALAIIPLRTLRRIVTSIIVRGVPLTSGATPKKRRIDFGVSLRSSLFPALLPQSPLELGQAFQFLEALEVE